MAYTVEPRTAKKMMILVDAINTKVAAMGVARWRYGRGVRVQEIPSDTRDEDHMHYFVFGPKERGKPVDVVDEFCVVKRDGLEVR